jgi:uncharacterized protein (DUF924 family)
MRNRQKPISRDNGDGSRNPADWVGDVYRFWFELGTAQWFGTDPALDAAIRRRFCELYRSLQIEPPSATNPTQSVAAAIVLDQFPRNMFRGTAPEYATDFSALAISQSAIESGFDHRVGSSERLFLYMPYQHSEDPTVQQRSVELFTALGDPEAYESALQHKAIIDRFGRFPHRNVILGRASSPEETEFLKTAPSFQ